MRKVFTQQFSKLIEHKDQEQNDNNIKTTGVHQYLHMNNIITLQEWQETTTNNSQGQ